MTTEAQTKAAMDRMYRLTRHVYDASRKYYLLGRDHLIGNLDAKAGETVCEAGCGTARNLIKMARKYPRAVFCGLDASEEMLKTARNSIERAGLKIPLAHAFAQSFDPQKLFEIQKPLDKVVFSYALSIIPPWRESIDHALKILKPGGEIHIVDFGGQDELPAVFRKFLFWWLAQFHVYHKPEILNYLHRLELEKKGTLRVKQLFKGYAFYAVFTAKEK